MSSTPAPVAPGSVPGATGARPQAAAGPRRTRRRSGSNQQIPAWQALLWLGPALALIVGIVLVPAVMLFQASRSEYSITGLRKGGAGWTNYANVLSHADLGTVLKNTAIWVVAVVIITIVLSLAIAQLLIQRFPGRKVVRWVLIIPWAASLIVTSQLFVLIYDYNYGMLNWLLLKVGIISTPIDFLGNDNWTMASMVVVGVFVSIPFTAYVFVAGLNAIPSDVFEAAKIDGATPWQTWRRITLPLLRPALMVASVLNIIYVFNSFPIVYTLNDRNPGYLHDTTITFMYKLAFRSQEKDVGMSAAMGVLNVLLILVVVVIYLRVTSWREEAGE